MSEFPEFEILPPELIPQSDPNAVRVEDTSPPKPTEFSEQLIMVIPVGKKTQGEALARSMDRGVKGETFTVGLSPTGKLPITHYWCGWTVTPAMAGIAKAAPAAAQAQIFDMEEYTPEQVLSTLGLKRIESDPLV